MITKYKNVSNDLKINLRTVLKRFHKIITFKITIHVTDLETDNW